MSKVLWRYFIYIFIFVLILVLRSVVVEPSACHIVPDPMILLVFVLFEFNVKTYIKYLVVLIFSFLYSEFSIGSVLGFILSYSVLYYTYQKMITILTRDSTYSLLFSIAVSLAMYFFYAKLLSGFSEFASCEMMSCLCEYLINLVFDFSVLLFLIPRLRRTNA